MPVKLTSTRQSIDAVKMLVYGESGVGKTVLCSTAPDPIIISAEKGLLSLAEFDIPVIEITSLDELEEAHAYCVKSKHETICLDSITEIAELILAEFQSKYHDGRKAYGEMQRETAHWIRQFRDIAGKNVFITAQIERYEDAHTGISTFKASMPGKTMAKKLPFFFDEVLCLRIGERQVDGKIEEFRYLQTQPELSYHAKDRSGKLNKIERPNLKLIINKITGQVKPKTKEVNKT